MWAKCLGRSPKMSDVSELLKSLTKNEWPWAISSGCSPKMSKLANGSLLWANHSFTHFFTQKTAICSENRWENSTPLLEHSTLKSNLENCNFEQCNFWNNILYTLIWDIVTLLYNSDPKPKLFIYKKHYEIVNCSNKMLDYFVKKHFWMWITFIY